MINTRDIALDILMGELDTSDLVNDVEFLKEVDESILLLVKKNNTWSDSFVAKKRKAILIKIEKLSEG
ncbi:gp590 [Bacillus phage G]|uniref:Gp590 n=1 Tax=Bacillus phage G TaxID=2884420 RepID=G3MAX0_9CAUD|nr:gp590 [Bacillus phage G]AEO93835.1 gp590 [Bacillus phage G]